MKTNINVACIMISAVLPAMGCCSCKHKEEAQPPAIVRAPPLPQEQGVPLPPPPIVKTTPPVVLGPQIVGPTFPPPPPPRISTSPPIVVVPQGIPSTSAPPPMTSPPTTSGLPVLPPAVVITTLRPEIQAGEQAVSNLSKRLLDLISAEVLDVGLLKTFSADVRSVAANYFGNSSQLGICLTNRILSLQNLIQQSGEGYYKLSPAGGIYSKAFPNLQRRYDNQLRNMSQLTEVRMALLRVAKSTIDYANGLTFGVRAGELPTKSAINEQLMTDVSALNRTSIKLENLESSIDMP